MGRMSREKGKRFEREAVKLFNEHGYDAHRTSQFKGKTGEAGDIEGVPGIHIECKHQERMNLYQWMDQSINDASAKYKGKLPVVIHKANNKPVLVTMRFEDWIKLYREYASGIWFANQEQEMVFKKEVK